MVMITSSSSGALESPQTILQSGFLGFSMKPYHPLQLKNLIASVWEAHLHKDHSRLITYNSMAMTSPAMPAPAVPAPPEKVASMHSQRMLVVDDMPVNRILLVETLKLLGYGVDEASNGFEALERMAAQNYAMVFMDCHMPEMDGYQATLEIRKQEQGAAAGSVRIPVIAITADALKGNEERCLQAGMDDFLTKPLKRNTLEAVIKKWLK